MRFLQRGAMQCVRAVRGARARALKRKSANLACAYENQRARQMVTSAASAEEAAGMGKRVWRG